MVLRKKVLLCSVRSVVSLTLVPLISNFKITANIQKIINVLTPANNVVMYSLNNEETLIQGPLL